MPPDATNDQVDWRGVKRLNERGNRIDRSEPPPNPVTQLANNAPYRIHVATSDGSSVKITDAFTLERRKVFRGSVLGMAFSRDGHWLYVAHSRAKRIHIAAIQVQSAKVRNLGSTRIKSTESLIILRGHGNVDTPHASALIGRGTGWRPGKDCPTWRQIRLVRFRLRRDKPSVTFDTSPKLRRPWFRRSRSPNTHFTAELGSNLTLFRHGRGNQKIDKLAGAHHIRGSVALSWMRDSRGMWLMTQRRPEGRCKALRGAITFRLAPGRAARFRRSWQRWRVPKDLQLTRGDLAHQPLTVTPDGMRLIAINEAGVFLVEPSPRPASLRYSMIAPPSKIWPVVRPGVRSLSIGASDHRQLTLLLEQGALKAADALLSQTVDSPTKAALVKRLNKLRAVRERRVAEFRPFTSDKWIARLPGAASATSDEPSH
ncbi:MAG TPA: hypothetical protein DCQ06_01155 [Myxococcales bacterium]|nr:hypothetical protein [Myxococcales bacterium]HAN30181.1 hypothetical protein [Myxococcales bacterium]